MLVDYKGLRLRIRAYIVCHEKTYEVSAMFKCLFMPVNLQITFWLCKVLKRLIAT